jgi:hypothetical protein
MSEFNFNLKKFVLIENSKHGTVNDQTIFNYQQEGDLVTAEYSGGLIKCGKIIAILKGDELNMLYQCLTTDNQLRAGKAIAKITLTEAGKLKLLLNWEWLGQSHEKGQSEYIECT